MFVYVLWTCYTFDFQGVAQNMFWGKTPNFFPLKKEIASTYQHTKTLSNEGQNRTDTQHNLYHPVYAVPAL